MGENLEILRLGCLKLGVYSVKVGFVAACSAGLITGCWISAVADTSGGGD
jgi:hypothetical protein